MDERLNNVEIGLSKVEHKVDKIDDRLIKVEINQEVTNKKMDTIIEIQENHMTRTERMTEELKHEVNDRFATDEKVISYLARTKVSKNRKRTV